MDAQRKPTIGTVLSGPDEARSVKNTCDKYLTFFDIKKEEKEGTTDRKNNSLTVVDSYYDLATDFFEYGWGESFHFAPLRKGESREHSFAKHEYWLAHKLQIKEGERVLVSFVIDNFISFILEFLNPMGDCCGSVHTVMCSIHISYYYL